MTFELSAELEPRHDQDVKCVLAIDDDRIASASRDGSVGVWHRLEKAFGLKALLNGHHAYVNSLALIPATTTSPELLASGGNSTLILLHSLSDLNSEPVDCLIGHTLNVCTLAFGRSSRRLISGSWDCTARVWCETSQKEKGGVGESSSTSSWETELLLEGHEAAVWGVAVVEQGARKGCYLTGSADQLVFVWSGSGEVLHRIKGFPEPVRSLVVLPEGDAFANGCNDGLVRVMDFEGQVLNTLKGHSDSSFQITLAPDAQVWSCGEDHSARSWSVDGTADAVLLHPCQTVWSVSVLPNGDVVTGGSDGRVRTWTKDAARKAPRGVIENIGVGVLGSQCGEWFPRDYHKRRYQSVSSSDDQPPLSLTVRPEDHPRDKAVEFVKEHDLPESYVDRIEAFIRAHLGGAVIDLEVEGADEDQA